MSVTGQLISMGVAHQCYGPAGEHERGTGVL